MNLGTLLLAIWLILLGATWLTWLTVETKFLGLWAFITGIIWLVETVHPIVVYKPRP